MTLYDRRYVLHERLGAGGMGEVYRATDRLAGRSVALKRVLTSAPDRDNASLGGRAALADEFQILASLRHPNIVSVLDYGFDRDQKPYFTMTLLRAPRTFAHYALTLPVPERMALVVEVLRALAYLHRRGIVHRDLKPANVLVDAGGHLRVLDFGLAARRGSERRSAGTLGYIAPEVLRGEAATEASDLFAVGVMAYEVLAGARPFDGPDSQSVIEAVLHGDADFARLSRAVETSPGAPTGATAEDWAELPTSPRVPATEPSIPAAEDVTRAFDLTGAMPGGAPGRSPAPQPAATLVGVVRRLLARDPRDRYSNAAAVVREISAVMGTPLPAETADTRESFLQAAPLIGRDDERQRLLGALDEVATGRGRVLLVGGESGVGKSRLLDEMRTAALVRGVNVALGQAVSEGGAPYQLWRGPLRQLVVLSEPTDFQAGVVKAVVPDVEMLLGRPVPDPPPVSTDARQERLLSVIEQLFDIRTPTLVVLEDLHWARDGAALLRRLVTVAARAPLLVVGSYRHDEARSLPDQVAGAERMDLDRLSASSVAALTEAMLGSVPGRDKLAEYLHRETEGNAFFLVEVVRSLAEQAGQLDDVGRMALPERVLSGGMRQLIGQRLERVPAEHRARLRLAAVLGRELDLAALGAGAVDLEEWLLACSAASVLEVQRDRWRFSHDKLRETLVAGLSDNERVSLHQQAAEGLEAAYPDRGAHAAALAHHWGVAGDRTKEALYAALGGQRAFEGAAFPEAVALLTRALDLAAADSSLPIEIAPTERLLGEALMVTGHFEEARARLERAVRHLGGPVPTLSAARTSVTLAGQVVRQVLHRLVPSFFIGRARTPDARARMLLLSRAYERIGHCHYQVGRSLPTVCASLLNLNSSEQAGPSIELARSYGTQILGAGMVGQHRMARMYMRLARDAQDGITDQAAHGWVDLMAVTYLVGVGAWAEMDEIIPRATALQEALGDRRRLQETVMVGACGDYFRGRFAQSLTASERVWNLAVDAEGWQPRVWSTAGLVQAGLVSGAADTLRRLAGNPVVGQTWPSIDGLWLSGALARCYLRAGDFEAARVEAERALELMPKTPPVAGYVLEGYAGATEVQIALWDRAVSPEARAESFKASQRGLSTIERFAGMFPVGEPRAAFCRGLYERTLRRDAEAAAAFERARAAGLRLRMPYEAALAGAELGLLLGPRHSRGEALLAQAYQTFDALGASEDARLTLRRRREAEGGR